MQVQYQIKHGIAHVDQSGIIEIDNSIMNALSIADQDQYIEDEIDRETHGALLYDWWVL